MKTKLVALALAAGMAATAAHADGVKLPSGVTQPAFFDANGVTVLGYQRGPGGLNVWNVERNNVKTVLYTTADNKVLFSGVLWDARTGSNLSDAFIGQDMMQAAASTAEGAQSNATVRQPEHAAAGKVSLPISGVAALRGVKEGNGPVQKTLYIMIDPRCPHCKNVFFATRDFVRSGGSIKWIPTTVLGHDVDGSAMVADILQDPNPIQALARVESGGFRQPSTISTDTTKAIGENEEYFWAAFDRNKSAGPAGVPVAFFQAPDGSPQMVSDLDNPVTLGSILKDMK